MLRWLFFEQAEVIPGIAGLRFRQITGRLAPDSPAVKTRRAVGETALGVLNGHLGEHELVGAEGYSVADISLYAYVHVAQEAGYDLADYPAVQAWIERVEGTPRHMNDLEPYGANAWPGAGRSIYG